MIEHEFCQMCSVKTLLLSFAVWIACKLHNCEQNFLILKCLNFWIWYSNYAFQMGFQFQVVDKKDEHNELQNGQTIHEN